ncbi:helix-turn-helix transcriptional regulator [Vannielia sp. SX4]|uniref:helix-turn-helix transcriptional regulator n=1 Tax=Vannielia sp. SX4 TaxID=3463852 RepID=UPI0040583D85
MLTQQIRALEARIEELESRLDLPNLMTARQVCAYVGMSERRFYELKEEGDTPPAIIWGARSVRYDRDDVIAWVTAHKAGA